MPHALISISLLLSIKGGETSPFNTIYIQYVPACLCCVHEGLCGKCTDVGAANCCYEMIHIASLSSRGMCAIFSFTISGYKGGETTPISTIHT